MCVPKLAGFRLSEPAPFAKRSQPPISLLSEAIAKGFLELRPTTEENGMTLYHMGNQSLLVTLLLIAVVIAIVIVIDDCCCYQIAIADCYFYC